MLRVGGGGGVGEGAVERGRGHDAVRRVCVHCGLGGGARGEGLGRRRAGDLHAGAAGVLGRGVKRRSVGAHAGHAGEAGATMRMQAHSYSGLARLQHGQAHRTGAAIIYD